MYPKIIAIAAISVFGTAAFCHQCLARDGWGRLPEKHPEKLLERQVGLEMQKSGLPNIEKNAELSKRKRLKHLLAQARQSGNSAEIGRVLDAELKKDPKNDYALYLRAKWLSGKNNYQGAIADANAFLKLHPAEPEMLLLRADAYSSAGMHKEANADLELAQKLNFTSHTIEVLESVSDIIDAGHPMRALNILEREIKANPNCADLYLFKAICETQEDKFDEATRDFERCILKQSPPNAVTGDALMEKMRNWESLAKYDLAVLDGTKAITLLEKLYKQNAWAPSYIRSLDILIRRSYNLRAVAYTGLNKQNEAIADMTKSMQMNPDTEHEEYERRAQMFKKAGRYKEAIADYTVALKLAPSIWQIRTERMDCYIRMHDFDSALNEVNAMMKASPDDEYLFLVRGNLYLAKTKYAEAIEDYSTAIKMDSDKDVPTYYIQRAKAYRALGRNDLARADDQVAQKLSAIKKSVN